MQRGDSQRLTLDSFDSLDSRDSLDSLDPLDPLANVISKAPQVPTQSAEMREREKVCVCVSNLVWGAS